MKPFSAKVRWFIDNKKYNELEKELERHLSDVDDWLDYIDMLKCCGNCRYFCYHRIPYGGVLFYCHNNDREYLNRNDLCDKWELIYG